MKSSLVAIASFVLIVAVALPASAQTTTIPVKPTPPQDSVKRVEERKVRIKTKLDAVQTRRIADRCVAAQTKIQQIIDKSGKKTDQNQKAYEAYMDRLNELDKNLSDNGVKSTELLQQIAVVKEKYAALASATSTYQSALSDSKTLDCKADPTAFKAAVEDARAQTLVIKQSQKDLLQYIRLTLKPTLENLKKTAR